MSLCVFHSCERLFIHRMWNIMANSCIYLYEWWMHNGVDMLKCRVAFKNTKSHCSFTHIKHSFHQIYFNCIFSVYQFILISLSLFAARAFSYVWVGVWILLLLRWIALICGFSVVPNCVFVCLFPVFVVIFCVRVCERVSVRIGWCFAYYFG